MNRADLEEKVYELIKADMEYINTPDDEIWSEIKKATTAQIENFIEELEER